MKVTDEKSWIRTGPEPKFHGSGILRNIVVDNEMKFDIKPCGLPLLSASSEENREWTFEWDKYAVLHDTSEIDTIKRFWFGNLDLGHFFLGAKVIDMVSESKQMLIFLYYETQLYESTKALICLQLF